MKGIFSSIRRDSFLWHNSVFFFGSFVAAFFNYLFHPLLGRIMKIEDFGEVQAALSLLLLSTVTISVFAKLITNLVAQKDQGSEQEALIRLFGQTSVGLAFFVFVLLAFFSVFLQTSLQFESYFPFVGVGILALFSAFITLRSAYLEGEHSFFHASVGTIIGSLGRLLFALLAIFLGGAVFGVIIGIVLSQFFVLLYYRRYTQRFLLFSKTLITGVLWNRFKHELLYAVLIFFVLLGITLFFSTDVILVKFFFSPEEAGLYSGISSIARIVFFMSGSVVGVLFPYIHSGQSHSMNQLTLLKAFACILVVSGGTWFAFFLFPEFAVRVLIGERFLGVFSLLPWLGAFQLLVSFLQVVLMYYLALRDYFLIPFIFAGVVTTAFLSWVLHDSLLHIVQNFMIGVAVVLGLLFFRFLWWNLKAPLFSFLRS